MRARLVIGGLGAALAISALSAGHAWACAEPKLATGGTFGPGDTVGYSISGIEPGASYTLTAPDGSVLDSGTASGSVSGSFTMPDLGSEATTMNVHMEADHNATGTSHPDGGARYTSDATVGYEPPAPPPPPPGDDPPVEQPTPAGESSGVESGSKEVAGEPEAGRPATTPGAPAVAVAGAPVQAATASPSASSSGAPTASLNGRQAEARAGVAAESRAAAGDAVGQPAAAIVGPVDPPAVGDPAWFVGLVLLIVAPLATAAMLRRGDGESERVAAPLWIPPDLDEGVTLTARLIEAELQEIIAEERARQLLGPPADDEPLRTSERRTRASSTV